MRSTTPQSSGVISLPAQDRLAGVMARISLVMAISGCATGSPPATALNTHPAHIRLAEAQYDLARYWIGQERTSAAMQVLDQALMADLQHVEATRAISARKQETLSLAHRVESSTLLGVTSVLKASPTHDSFVRVTLADATSAATVADRLIVQRADGQTGSIKDQSLFTETRIDLANGNGAVGLARALRAQLSEAGLPVRRVRNWVNFDQQLTLVYYRNGFESAARTVSKSLPVDAAVSMMSPAHLGRRDVLVVLGHDLKSL